MENSNWSNAKASTKAQIVKKAGQSDFK